MKNYIKPNFLSVELSSHHIICASNISKKTSTSQSSSVGKSTSINNVYDTLTHTQKLAALHLMFAFGGSCNGNAVAINKINHIMTVEGGKMGISSAELHSTQNMFSSMKEMASHLTIINRECKENLFWAMYCIVAAGKNKEAVMVLTGVFGDIGLSESECLSILQKRTGINF